MKRLSINGLKHLNLIKFIGFLGMAITLLLGFKTDFSLLLTVAYISILVFLTGSFFFFIDGTHEERKVLIDIWKLYISVVTVMIILIYTMENNANKILLEYDKTKLLFDIRTNSNDINKSFKSYESTIKKIQKRYEGKELEGSVDLKEKSNNVKTKKAYMNFYFNLACIVIIIMTIFVSLWFVIEREEILHSKKSQSYLKKYKQVIAERKTYLRK